LAVIAECETADWEWISSEVIELEVSRIPDAERRRRVQMLASHSHRSVVVKQMEMKRAQEFEGWGIPAYDALHLACAESGGADVFLTTDDELIRRSAAHAKQLQIRVENPLTWAEEVLV